MTDTSVPSSLRYTFKEDLDWFPVTKDSEPNYLVSALYYNNSFLLENLLAQPFPYLQDPFVRADLTCDQYFVNGYELTNARRIEDLAVLDFEPELSCLAPNHKLLPIQHELRKEFNYLHSQVKYYKRRLFDIWVEHNHQDLFKFASSDNEVVDHPYEIGRLFHQFELESIRYLKLNKFHLIQAKADQHNLSIGAKNQLYTSWKRFVNPKVEVHRHFLEVADPGLKYVYDYDLDPFHRRFERHWDLESEVELRKTSKKPLIYPFTPLKSVRKEQWVQSTRPANTRFVFSDLGFDPEEKRFGSEIETLSRLYRQGWHRQGWR